MIRTTIAAVCVAVLLLASCGREEAPGRDGPDATQLTQASIVVDTHIDVPYRLQQDPADVSTSLDSGDFDYPRAKAGGLDVAFMSIYTPAALEAEGSSYEVANQLIDLVEELVAEHPDKFAIALGPADARKQVAEGLISLPMGMENGSPLEGSMDKLRHFYDRGIRYITLAHGLSNHLSDSSYDDSRPLGGLSEFGVDVVREMNRLGIMVDVSHLSDEAFWDVIDVSTAPVIASHSSARHFTPGFERNIADDMIEAIAENGGVVMINFGSAFLTARANEYSMARWDAEEEWRVEHSDLSDEEADDLFKAIWEEQHGPYPFADIGDVLDHIDHVVDLVGVDFVGLGSDYDGVGDSLPTGLKDVSTYPNLVEGLLARGYSEDDVKKILGENLLRVWQAVEENAAATQ